MRFPPTTAAAMAIVGMTTMSFYSASAVEASSVHSTDRHIKLPPRGLRIKTATSESIVNDAQLGVARQPKALAVDTLAAANNAGRNLQASSFACPTLTDQLAADYECTCEGTSPTSLVLSCTPSEDTPKCEPIPEAGSPGSEGSNIYQGEVCATGSFEMTLSGTTINDVINSPDTTFEGCYEYTESAQDVLAGREVCYTYVLGTEGFSCDATLNDLPCTCSECIAMDGTRGLQLSCNNLVPDLAGTCQGTDQENLGMVPRFDATNEDPVVAPDDADPEQPMQPIANSTEGTISNETTIIFPTIPGLEGVDNIDEETEQMAEKCIASGGTVTTRGCCADSGNFPSTCVIGACGCSPDASVPTAVCECPTDTCFDSRPSVGICIPGDAGSTIGEEEEDKEDGEDEDREDEDEGTPSTLPESNMTVPDEGNMTLPDEGNMTIAEEDEDIGMDNEIDLTNATKAEICSMTGGNVTTASLCIDSDAFPSTCGMTMEPTSSPTVLINESIANITDTNMTDTNMTDTNMTDTNTDDMNMTLDVAEPSAPPTSITDNVSTILPVMNEPTAAVTTAPTMAVTGNRKLQFGCAPEESEEKELCECPPGTCFDPEMGCIDAMPDVETNEPTAQPTDAPTTFAPTSREPTVAPTVMKETSSPTPEVEGGGGDTSSGSVAKMTITAAAAVFGILFVGIY